EDAGKPIIHGYFRSSCSWRVRIDFALKGIEFDQVPVNLIKDGGQQFTEQYKGLNPIQQVPAVQIDGITLSQSNLYVLQKLRAEKVQWAHNFIQRGFEALEPILKETAGKYCVRDEISMADICLVPQVYNAERRQPQSFRIVDAFKESHPSCQLDTPAEICT
uniref:Glutathione S-transferase zeta 1 n=1 Tax=Hucho hucho TaxID=62062 RepID=A0A4W5MUP4_9TELE